MIGPGFRLAVCTMAAAAALAACTPEYNWREIDVAGGRASAAFPARVATETRALVLAGQPLSFSLTTAMVGPSVFAVGYAPLPPAAQADPAARARLAQALVDTFYANLGAAPPVPRPAPGDVVRVLGGQGGRATRLTGRVQVMDGALVEAVAIGPQDALAPEQADEFVRSLRAR